MKMKEIYELSHRVDPDKEEYRLEVDSRQVEGWEQFSKYPRLPEHQYLISEVTLCTHIGTHIEMPFHHDAEGLDTADFPAEKLVGETVVLDVSQYGNNEEIPLNELKQIADGQIKPGDIVFFYTGLDKNYYSNKQHDRPYFATDAIRWLIEDVKIKLMGVDTSGHEIRHKDGSPVIGQPNHELLLKSGVPLIEYLTNLKPLIGKRTWTFTLPVRIMGLEAFPARVIAIEWEDA
jgi:arylformamidase